MSSASQDKDSLETQLAMTNVPLRTGQMFCRCRCVIGRKFHGGRPGYCQMAYCACVKHGRPCNERCACDPSGQCRNCNNVIVTSEATTPICSEAQPDATEARTPQKRERCDDLADAHVKIAKLQVVLQETTSKGEAAKKEVRHLYALAKTSKEQIAQLIREKDLLHSQLAMLEMRAEEARRGGIRVEDPDVDTGMFFE